MKTGSGSSPRPSAVEAQIVEQYRVGILGRIDEVRERFYAITTERRLERARSDVFGP